MQSPTQTPNQTSTQWPTQSRFMSQAMAAARAAAKRGEVPVGAVLVDATGQVIAEDGNRVEQLGDGTAHAEMLVLRRGHRLLGRYLQQCDLYVTLEPCAMCAQAISLARLRRLYFGAEDSKSGGVYHGGRIFQQPTCHHRPEVYSGIQEREAAQLLTDFFAARR